MPGDSTTSPGTGVRPARPGTAYTAQGRRVREVFSYSRRGSRLSAAHARVWELNAGRWWIPDELVDEPGFALADRFERRAPLAVEIGSGSGEATAALAAAHPELNVAAFEVWRPGLAETMTWLDDAGVENVRLLSVDAVWSFAHLLSPATVTEVWTFFPDPWPKQRHHKRRLVDPAFARLVADRLVPGGTWRLATDWPAYARSIQEVLDAEPMLCGGPTARWERRPTTRFERRGLAEGRAITDLNYRGR